MAVSNRYGSRQDLAIRYHGEALFGTYRSLLVADGYTRTGFGGVTGLKTLVQITSTPIFKLWSMLN